MVARFIVCIEVKVIRRYETELREVGAAVVGLAVGVTVGRSVGEMDGAAVVGAMVGVMVGWLVVGLDVVGGLVKGGKVIVG